MGECAQKMPLYKNGAPRRKRAEFLCQNIVATRREVQIAGCRSVPARPFDAT